MALYTYRISNEAIPRYSLVKLSSTSAGRVELFKVGDSVAKATGVALTRATQAGVQIRVQEVSGVAANMLSDGTTVIAAGDSVEPSATLDGYIRKSSGSNIIGQALSGASAVVGALVEVL